MKDLLFRQSLQRKGTRTLTASQKTRHSDPIEACFIVRCWSILQVHHSPLLRFRKHGCLSQDPSRSKKEDFLRKHCSRSRARTWSPFFSDGHLSEEVVRTFLMRNATETSLFNTTRGAHMSTTQQRTLHHLSQSLWAREQIGQSFGRRHSEAISAKRKRKESCQKTMVFSLFLPYVFTKDGSKAAQKSYAAGPICRWMMPIRFTSSLIEDHIFRFLNVKKSWKNDLSAAMFKKWREGEEQKSCGMR